jgi:hypothetical protein
MIKRLTYLLFVLMLSVTVSAQEYFSFPEDNATWTVNYEDWSNPSSPIYKTYQYYYNGDTIFYYHIAQDGDTVYQTDTCTKVFVRIHSSDGVPDFYEGPEGYMKTDNESRKVYYSDLNYLYSGLSLLYDFNLTEGDTLSGLLIEQSLGDIITVTYIDSVLIGNTYSKQYNLSSEWVGALQSKLIEGVGSTAGLTWSYYVHERYSYLACFAIDAAALYPVYSDIPCELVTDLMEAVNAERLSIYPNPATTELRIQTNSPIADLKIYNTQGQLVTSSVVKEPLTTIDVSSFASGLYYLTLQSKEGVITKKVEVVR